ncbi:MAG: pilus assembly protein [Pseudomonadota bacterium]
MFHKMKSRLSLFSRNSEGSASLEGIIIAPVVLWAIAAGFTYFEAFRAQSVAEKAAYTVSDMISRETLPITPAYVTNMRKIYRDLSGLNNAETALRITVMRWDETDGRFYIDWAKRRGDIPKLRNRDIGDYDDLLPQLVDNERIILVETSSDYAPAISGVIPSRTIETFVYTRPRYAPQLVWDAEG